MPFPVRLAFRQLRSRPSSLARLTAAVAFGGILLGVGGLVFVDSLTRGFTTRLETVLLANLPHITVQNIDGTALDSFESTAALIRLNQEIRDIEPVSVIDAAAMSASGGMARATIIARDTEAADADAIRIGRGLAARLGVRTGDTIEVLTLASREPVGFQVSGELSTGVFDYDMSWITCSRGMFAKLNGRDEIKPSVLAVTLNDVNDAGRVTAALRSQLGAHFLVSSWQESNRPLFLALETERRLVFALITLIVLFAMFNISASLAVRVSERSGEIAVLKTCGARPRMIIGLFVTEGMLIAFPGILCGIFTGLGVGWLVMKLGWLRLPAEVYMLDVIPLEPSPAAIAVIAAAAVFLALAASFLPALQASRIKPLENLRRR